MFHKSSAWTSTLHLPLIIYKDNHHDLNLGIDLPQILRRRLLLRTNSIALRALDNIIEGLTHTGLTTRYLITLLRMNNGAIARQTSLISIGVIRMTLLTDGRNGSLIYGIGHKMAKLLRRLNRTHAIQRLMLHKNVRIKTRLYRHLLLNMTNRIGTRHTNGLLRNLRLNNATSSKRQSTRISYQALALRRRIKLRMSLTVNSKSRIHQSMNESITLLHLSSQRHHRQTTAVNIKGLTNALRRTEIRMRSIAEMNLTSKQAIRHG